MKKGKKNEFTYDHLLIFAFEKPTFVMSICLFNTLFSMLVFFFSCKWIDAQDDLIFLQ